MERALASLRRQLNIARAIRPVCGSLRIHHVCRIIDFDPAPFLERLHVPVLALFGEVDPMVPPDPNVRLLGGALERGGNRAVTIRVLAGANHDFLAARTGLPAEYATLERSHEPGFCDVMLAGSACGKLMCE